MSDPTGLNTPRAPSSSRAATWALALSLIAILLGIAALQAASKADIAASSAEVPSTSQIAGARSSLYSAPTDIKVLIDEVQKSTVIVECGEWFGSGWVIDLPPLDPASAAAEDLEVDRAYPVEVITNHHVIEDCTDDRTPVTVTKDGETYEAVVYSWDEENDLAMVATSHAFPALIPSDKPQPGWWAMAVGAPDGLEGSISLGNVMNTDGSDVISTAPLNGGNSGGPLVNARGEVIGTNSWVLFRDGEDEYQDWNIAVGVPKLCDVLLTCTDGYLSW